MENQFEGTTRGFSRLYCNECIIEGCETNTQLVKMFVELDNADQANDPTTLDFSLTYLGDRNIAALSAVVSTMFSVKEISFRNMDLQAYGIEAICRMATKHPSLYRIDLRDNPLYATSGRHIAQLLKSNPRITQLFFDGTEMPDRIRSAILRQLGRNIARAYPTQEGYEANTQQVEEELKEPETDTSVSASPFESQIVKEAELNRIVLSECYSRCGLFACQFFSDFGPKGLALLQRHLAFFTRTSQDQAFSVEPLEHLAPEHYVSEMEKLTQNQHVRAESDGTVLWDQISSALDQANTINDETSLREVSKLIQHVRRSVGGFFAGLMADVDEDINDLGNHLVDELWERTRKLIVLHDRVRYFCMDYPEMVKEVLQRYQSCQPPLRDTWTTLLHEVRYVARSPYAAGRRELLAEAIELLPARINEFLLQRVIGWSLDRSAGFRGFHSYSMGVDEDTPQVEFTDVIGHKFLTRGQLRSFLLLFAYHMRYHALLEGWTPAKSE